MDSIISPPIALLIGIFKIPPLLVHLDQVYFRKILLIIHLKSEHTPQYSDFDEFFAHYGQFGKFYETRSLDNTSFFVTNTYARVTPDVIPCIDSI